MSGVLPMDFFEGDHQEVSVTKADGRITKWISGKGERQADGISIRGRKTGVVERPLGPR